MTAEDAQRADEAPVVAYEKASGGFSEVQRIRDEEMPSIMEGLDLSAFDDLLKDLEAQADEALLMVRRERKAMSWLRLACSRMLMPRVE